MTILPTLDDPRPPAAGARTGSPEALPVHAVAVAGLNKVYRSRGS